MAVSTVTPSFATNSANVADGVTFDIPSGKTTINVKVTNDSVTFKPVPRGSLHFSGKGVTTCNLTFWAYDARRRVIDLVNTAKLGELMKYKKDPGDGKNKLDTFPEVHYKLRINTRYTISAGHTADDLTQGYGRGTTDDDTTAQNTSLRFHESQHSGFAMSYLNTNAIPVVDLKQGLLKIEVDKLIYQFFVNFDSYNNKLQFLMQYDVDCVGTVPGFCSALDTRKTAEGY